MSNDNETNWPSLIPMSEDRIGPFSILVSLAYTKYDSYQRYGIIFCIERFDTSDEAENFKTRFAEFLQEFIVDHRKKNGAEWHIWIAQPLQVLSSTPYQYMTKFRSKIARSYKVWIKQANNFNVILNQMIKKLQGIAKETD